MNIVHIIELGFVNWKLAAMRHETILANFCVSKEQYFETINPFIRRFWKIENILFSADSWKFSADERNARRYPAIDDSVHKVAGTTKHFSVRKEIFERLIIQSVKVCTASYRDKWKPNKTPWSSNASRIFPASSKFKPLKAAQHLIAINERTRNNLDQVVMCPEISGRHELCDLIKFQSSMATAACVLQQIWHLSF